MDYAKPMITDYGTLVKLTEACSPSSGGDSAFPSGIAGGLSFGKDISTSVTQCHSN